MTVVITRGQALLTLVSMAVWGAFYLAGMRTPGRDAARVQDILAAREARHASGLHHAH